MNFKKNDRKQLFIDSIKPLNMYGDSDILMKINLC